MEKINRQLKVHIVVPYFTPYVKGNEYGLADALTKLGYDVTITASKAKAPREVKKVFSDNFDFNVKYLPTIMDVGENPLTYGLDIKDSDVVLLQEDYPFICHRAYKQAKKHGTKTVLSFVRAYYPKGYKGIVLRILDKLKNKELWQGSDVLTARCSVTKEFMEKELGIGKKIEVMYSGVDTGQFKPLNSESKYNKYLSGKFNILTVARLHNYKGLSYLIEAITLLRKNIPGIKLYIMGKGEERSNLNELIRKLGLEENVEFIEKTIPNDKMPSLYRECDVYVQPSLVEPYGIAILEAMACGKPVVGTKVGGMLDTIKDGDTGFLVEPKNSKELSDRIYRLRDQNVRISMGEKAREWTVNNFDWMVIGEKYQKIIEEIV